MHTCLYKHIYVYHYTFEDLSQERKLGTGEEAIKIEAYMISENKVQLHVSTNLTSISPGFAFDTPSTAAGVSVGLLAGSVGTALPWYCSLRAAVGKVEKLVGGGGCGTCWFMISTGCVSKWSGKTLAPVPGVVPECPRSGTSWVIYDGTLFWGYSSRSSQHLTTYLKNKKHRMHLKKSLWKTDLLRIHIVCQGPTCFRSFCIVLHLEDLNFFSQVLLFGSEPWPTTYMYGGPYHFFHKQFKLT